MNSRGERDTFSDSTKSEVGLVGGEGFSFNLSYDLNPSFYKRYNPIQGDITLFRGSFLGFNLLGNEEVSITT
jgi:hypothetical protein